MKKLVVFFLLLVTIASYVMAGGEKEKAGAVEEERPVEVVYAIGHDVKNLEPTQAAGWSDHVTNLAIFGTLAFNFDGVTGERGYYPYLAKSLEPIDDLIWEVKLHEGMTFHNGAPFTAEAIKFSYERIQDPDFPSGRFFKKLPIDKIEVVDDLTAHIYTTEPIPILPARMIRADGYIVEPGHYADSPPWEKVDKTAFNPVGAGPFKFESHKPDDSIVLSRFDNYKDSRGYELPNFDKLILKIIPEPSTLLAELLTGKVDIAPITSDLVTTIEEAEGLRVVYGDDTTRYGFPINTKAHPALGDKRVRQAINYAVNKDVIVETIGLGKAEKVIAHVNPPNEHPDLEPYPYDPQKASELLAEAGYPDGFTMNIDYSAPYDLMSKLANAVVSDLEAVGINIGEVRQLDWSSVFVPRMTEGTLEGLWGLGMGGVESTPETDLWTVHPERPTNSFNWADTPEAERFLELYEELSRTMDPQRRQELNYELQKIIYEEALILNLIRMPRIMAVSDKIEFYEPYPGGFMEDWPTIRVVE